MRKSLLIAMFSFLLIVGLSTISLATSLYVDSAPNVYGSPDWAPWWDQAKTDVVAESFTNMRTGHFPGKTKADPYDEIVYSTMDLGKRLHWIYWLPNETISNLDGLFQVKWVIDWDGGNWTYSDGGWVADGAEVGWTQPSSWEDYSGGVIGSFGFAWWATDNEAHPFDTNGSPYDETDQADIDALRQQVLLSQTFAKGMIRFKSDLSSGWQYMELNVDIEPVPEPATLLLLGSGLFGLAGFRKKKFHKKG